MSFRLILFGFMAAIGASVAGCAEATLIRRTALVPAPVAPTQTGFALEKGEVQLSGVIDSGAVTPYTSNDGLFFGRTGVAGDPGVLLPRLQLGVNARVGISRTFELGAFVRYAAHEWAEPNVHGVLRFPASDAPDIWSGGIGMRVNVSLADPRLQLAFIGDLVMAQVAEAVFLCVNPRICGGGVLVGDETADDIYSFQRVDREFFVLPQLGIHFGYAVIPELMPFIALGMTTSVTNTGFSNDLSSVSNDSLESYIMGYFALGIEGRLEAATLNLALFMPFGGVDLIDFGPMFNMRIGATFGGSAPFDE